MAEEETKHLMLSELVKDLQRTLAERGDMPVASVTENPEFGRLLNHGWDMRVETREIDQDDLNRMYWADPRMRPGRYLVVDVT